MSRPPSFLKITAYLRNWSLNDEACTISGWTYDTNDESWFPNNHFVTIKYQYMIEHKDLGASPNNWLIRSEAGDYFRVYEYEQLDLNENDERTTENPK